MSSYKLSYRVKALKRVTNYVGKLSVGKKILILQFVQGLLSRIAVICPHCTYQPSVLQICVQDCASHHKVTSVLFGVLKGLDYLVHGSAWIKQKYMKYSIYLISHNVWLRHCTGKQAINSQQEP